MTDSMIERVRAAIGQFNLDEMSPGYEDDLTRAARAAIEAMREPTGAMLDAGHMAMPVEYRYWQRDGMVHAEMLPSHECVSPASPFNAMIDAALSEKP